MKNIIKTIYGLMEVYGTNERHIEWVGIREISTCSWPEFKKNTENTVVKTLATGFVVKGDTWFIEVGETGELEFREIPKPGIVTGEIPENLLSESE